MALTGQEMILRIIVALMFGGIGVTALTVSVITVISTFRGAA